MSSTSLHAKLSPSGSKKWLVCVGAPAMESRVENVASNDAKFGTACHFLGSETLDRINDGTIVDGLIPESWLGNGLGRGLCREILLVDGVAQWVGADHIEVDAVEAARKEGNVFKVDDDMVDNVQRYIDQIMINVGEDGTLLVEQRLDISCITGEEGAKGTGDAIILKGNQIHIHDLKMRRIEMEPAGDTQLIIYGLAAYYEYAELHEMTTGYAIEEVVVGLHLPLIHHHPVHTYKIGELLEMENVIRAKAATGLELLEAVDTDPQLVLDSLTPGAHCSEGFCNALATCPVVSDYIEGLCDFDSLPATKEELLTIPLHVLARVKLVGKMIKSWVDAIDERVYRELVAGNEIPGFKLVPGNKGNREWTDLEEVEQIMTRSMKLRHEVAYARKLISPTAAEKAAKKGEIGPKQWKRLCDEYITRSDGKPTVAPMSDKRKAISLDDDFEAYDE